MAALLALLALLPCALALSLRGGANSSAGLTQRFPWYHTSSQLSAELRRLQSSCGGRLTLHAAEDSGVRIEAARVRGSPTASNRVFIVAGEHARELIASESVLRLLHALCGEAPLSPGHDAEDALADSEFEVVLDASPSARLLVERGDFCRRLNPQGVDLNRNWGERWSPKRSLGGSGGPRPFSEPETRLLRRLAEDFAPTTFLSVHSGTRGLYMPWAYDVLSAASSRLLQVLREVDAEHCRCPYGAAGAEVGYACPGTSIDWAYAQLRAPYTFAFEVWGGNATLLHQRWEAKVGTAPLREQLGHPHFRSLFEAHPSDFVQVLRHDVGAQPPVAEGDELRLACFRTFNPEDWVSYRGAVDNWAEAFMDTARLVVQDMKAPASDAD